MCLTGQFALVLKLCAEELSSDLVVVRTLWRGQCTHLQLLHEMVI